MQLMATVGLTYASASFGTNTKPLLCSNTTFLFHRSSADDANQGKVVARTCPEIESKESQTRREKEGGRRTRLSVS